MATTTITIYALKCVDNKWYIGRTDKKIPEERILQHFVTDASVWTTKYPPIKIDRVYANADVFDEDKITKKYMHDYGIDNVRGGSYCQIKLSWDQLTALRRELQVAQNACFKCGQVGHFANKCPHKLPNRRSTKRAPHSDPPSNKEPVAQQSLNPEPVTHKSLNPEPLIDFTSAKNWVEIPINPSSTQESPIDPISTNEPPKDPPLNKEVVSTENSPINTFWNSLQNTLSCVTEYLNGTPPQTPSTVETPMVQQLSPKLPKTSCPADMPVIPESLPETPQPIASVPPVAPLVQQPNSYNATVYQQSQYPHPPYQASQYPYPPSYQAAQYPHPPYQAPQYHYPPPYQAPQYLYYPPQYLAPSNSYATVQSTSDLTQSTGK